MIKIFIVYENQLLCNLVSKALTADPEIEVTGHATSTEETAAAIKKRPCDILLVCNSLPHNDIMHLIKSITSQQRSPKILVAGVPNHKHTILQYIMAGVSGYVLHDVSVSHLIENIHAIHANRALVSPAIAGAILTHISELSDCQGTQGRTSMRELADLTPREKEVLGLLAQNMSNREIADMLYIEVGTVKNHVHNLLQKLDATNRKEAAAFLNVPEK